MKSYYAENAMRASAEAQEIQQRLTSFHEYQVLPGETPYEALVRVTAEANRLRVAPQAAA